jgi:hypothetical protein
MLRRCTGCNIEKELNSDNFGNSNTGYRKRCKKCISIYRKEYRERNDVKIHEKQYAEINKEHIKLKAKERYSKTKNRILEKEWRTNNKDKIKSIKRKHYEKNKKVILEKSKKYYQEHKKETYITQKKYVEKNRAKVNSWRTEQRKRDKRFRLKGTVSSAITRLLLFNGGSKNKQSHTKYVPWTYIEFLKYLESLFEPWMNWNNFGKYDYKKWNDNDPSTWTWNIDHIISHSRFKYTTMDCQEFKDCWALENLRPYSAKLNIIDGNRRTDEDIKQIKYEIIKKIGKANV